MNCAHWCTLRRAPRPQDVTSTPVRSCVERSRVDVCVGPRAGALVVMSSAGLIAVLAGSGQGTTSGQTRVRVVPSSKFASSTTAAPGPVGDPTTVPPHTSTTAAPTPPTLPLTVPPTLRTTVPAPQPTSPPSTSAPTPTTAAAPADGNLVTDAGFEQPDVGIGIASMVIYKSGDDFYGWHVSSGEVFVHASIHGWVDAPEGNQVLSPRSPSGETPAQAGTVCQDVVTTSGSRYRFEFAASTATGASTLNASVDGTTEAFDLTDQDVWQSHQITFTASSTSSTICFAAVGVDASSGWPVVDSVSVTAL